MFIVTQDIYPSFVCISFEMHSNLTFFMETLNEQSYSYI